MHLILLGPPGAGKGTQAQRMAKRYGLEPLSSGDILRSEVRANSAVGSEAKQFMNAGTLVPDDMITQVMLAGIAKTPRDPGFILDGFPRTLAQAEALETGLAQADIAIDAVLNFDMPDNDVVRRIVGRRTCSNCHSTYNIDFLPPRTDGVCDDCGRELVQRDDDREDVVVTRLATYRVQTAPLIRHYGDKGLLHSIDASVPADQVETAVRGVMERIDSGT